MGGSSWGLSTAESFLAGVPISFETFEPGPFPQESGSLLVRIEHGGKTSLLGKLAQWAGLCVAAGGMVDGAVFSPAKVLGTYSLCHDFGNLLMAVAELKESWTQSRKQDMQKPQ